jgi:hypothetical protein
MIVYIVWKTDYDYGERVFHILGIYKDRNRALKKSAEFNEDHITKDEETNIVSEDKETDIIVSKNGLLGEYSLIGRDDLCYCTQLEVDDEATEGYFMRITEDGGGGSYHQYCWIYASTDEDELIDIAKDYFSTEHNRDDECQDCINNQCKDKFIRDLKHEQWACIDCTSYCDAVFEMWSVKI